MKLPDESRVAGDAASIRREGETVILEPVKPAAWPPGFFDRIRIDDPAFAPPTRGPYPARQPLIEGFLPRAQTA